MYLSGCLFKHDFVYKSLSVFNVFIMDHSYLMFFSPTNVQKSSVHMEPFSVSFPPQRSRCNELPVPPLLAIIPAAPSHHKHVTIMLATRPYPMVHLGCEGGRPDAGENEAGRGGTVGLVCTLVCLCERKLVMRG